MSNLPGPTDPRPGPADTLHIVEEQRQLARTRDTPWFRLLWVGLPATALLAAGTWPLTDPAGSHAGAWAATGLFAAWAIAGLAGLSLWHRRGVVPADADPFARPWTSLARGRRMAAAGVTLLAVALLAAGIAARSSTMLGGASLAGAVLVLVVGLPPWRRAR